MTTRKKAATPALTEEWTPATAAPWSLPEPRKNVPMHSAAPIGAQRGATTTPPPAREYRIMRDAKLTGETVMLGDTYTGGTIYHKSDGRIAWECYAQTKGHTCTINPYSAVPS